MGKKYLRKFTLLSYSEHLLMLPVSIFQAWLYYIQYWLLVGRGKVLYRPLNHYIVCINLGHHFNCMFMGDLKGRKAASHTPGCMESIMSFITKALLLTIYLKSTIGAILFSPQPSTLLYTYHQLILARLLVPSEL